MNNFISYIIFVSLIGGGFWLYKQEETKKFLEPYLGTSQTKEQGINNGSKKATSNYSCDGRTHCSQMKSCEEAMFFLNNCPNTKMDGNNDGIPCERQWCGQDADGVGYKGARNKPSVQIEWSKP